MRQLLLLPVLLMALACSGEPFAANEHMAPVEAGAGQPSEQAGGSAGAPVAEPGSAGAADAPVGEGGRAGEAPSGLAGADAGEGGVDPIPAGGTSGTAGAPSAGSAGAAPQEPDACEPPSQDGPLSGARDCTADCADGTVPCAGTCDGMSAGGCLGKYTLGEVGADLSFVLDPGDAWAIKVVQGVCARFTAMPGAELQVDGKPGACFAACSVDLQVVLGERGWLRAETASSPLGCAP